MAASVSAHSAGLAAPRVLIADDHDDVLVALRLLLKSEGYQVTAVSSPDAAIKALEAHPFDAILIDLNYTRDTTSGLEGLELLSRIRALNRDVPVIAMTAWGSIELAVDAMRTGLDDFIQKPWDNAQLLDHLRLHLQNGRARRQERGNTVHYSQELAGAREIQRNLLPQTLPVVRGVTLEAFWSPAGEVGGDFYDTAALDASTLWLGMGDVEGKGLSAALLMASVHGLMRASASARLAPSALCTGINDELCSRTTSGRFVTFFYCTYDVKRQRLSYVNAGHTPPCLIQADGYATWLAPGGPVLGIFPNSRFEQAEVQLGLGDRLVLFTDGITESRKEDGSEFGEERLLHLAVQSRHTSAGDMHRTIIGAARAHGDGTFTDDATLIVMGID